MSEQREQIGDLAAAQFDERIKEAMFRAVRSFVCHQCPEKERCEGPCGRAKMFMLMNFGRVARALVRWN